jgi:hypothetical protein
MNNKENNNNNSEFKRYETFYEPNKPKLNLKLSLNKTIFKPSKTIRSRNKRGSSLLISPIKIRSIQQHRTSVFAPKIENFNISTEEDLENEEEVEDTIDTEEDQEENPVEEESELDKELDELRDVLVDLDLNLYRIARKEDTNDVIYIIGKVAEDSNDVLMLVSNDIQNGDNLETDTPIENTMDNVEKEVVDDIVKESGLNESVKYTYLNDMLKDKNKQLVKHNELLDSDTGIESVFDFSNNNGGCTDSFKYYNDYVVIDKRNVKESGLNEAEEEIIDEPKEDEEEEKPTFDFVKLPISFDEINKLNPRYGEGLTPNHEAIMDYLMNCLIEENPEAAEELQSEKELEEPINPDDDKVDLDIDIGEEEEEE